MDYDWAQRWREGRIGFHEGKPNSYLEREFGQLAGKRRVLVPLCGKAVDLDFLAGHGHEVVGVELVEQAVQAFFAERHIEPTVTRRGPFVQYSAGSITLLAGDLFATDRALVGPCDALYDRAALIALPPELRQAYVPHLRGLLPPGSRALVVTISYDQSRMEGPPFSVPESEVKTLYAGAAVKLLGSSLVKSGGKCAEHGVPATEHCFVIDT